MKISAVKHFFSELRRIVFAGKPVTPNAQEREHEALRENMRGQFEQLKKRGLSIQITVL
jgi:hypothetical protein